jgi:hypothetical protein
MLDLGSKLLTLIRDVSCFITGFNFDYELLLTLN